MCISSFLVFSYHGSNAARRSPVPLREPVTGLAEPGVGLYATTLATGTDGACPWP